ncbi:hypothetical protein PI124_g17380 [Phytophthora idaei]|nr:hypothetical protein PI124_g17380 [Phytophthora idaei]
MSEIRNAPRVPRLVWSEDRVQTLLQARVVTYGPSFLRNNARAQLSKLWEKDRRKINKKHHLKVTISQVKYKYQALKAQFADIRADEDFGQSEPPPPRNPATVPLQEESLAVRQDEEEPEEMLPFSHSEGKPLPSRLETTLRSHREDKQSPPDSDMRILFKEYGNINWDEVNERLESGSSDADDSSDMEDSNTDAETGNTRDEAIAQEINHHDTLRRRQKLDLPGALVHFGESLASALAAPDGEGQESDVIC